MPLRDNFVIDRNHSANGRVAASAGSSHVDSLLRRAAMLPPRDRMLVELALRNNASLRQLARTLDMAPGCVSRRLRRLLTRLNEPIVAALSEPRTALPDEYRQLGLEHFLCGLTVRQLADLHQMNLRQVQRMIHHLRGWHRGLSTLER
jgi:DNA-directed RNA polymerase specialized sigma24 family protein